MSPKSSEWKGDSVFFTESFSQQVGKKVTPGVSPRAESTTKTAYNVLSAARCDAVVGGNPKNGLGTSAPVTGNTTATIMAGINKSTENGGSRKLMKSRLYIAGALTLTLFSAGCATKKYVAKTVAPVEARVATAESKNTEQDTKLAAQGTQIEAVDRDLSRTKERLTDTDAKAVAAGTAAKQAADAAKAADAKAQTAQSTADTAKTTAQSGLHGLDQLGKNVDSTLKYKVAKSGVVLFALGQKTLDKDAKAALDDFSTGLPGDRYVIEIQGFTDKTGDVVSNEALSQGRAETVARYLAAQHNVPLRNITLLGVGVAAGEQKTRDERKQSRKVELKLLTPEVASVSAKN
jgi:outer membrane protein OmpA-like peptidoglycan-associated protein